MTTQERCPKCDAPRVANTRFCGQCGTVMHGTSDVPRDPLPLTMPGTQTPNSQNPGTPVPPAADSSAGADWRKETLVGRQAPGPAARFPLTPMPYPAGGGSPVTSGHAPHERKTQETENPSREFAADTVIDGRYRVLNVLGGGGMGSVYRVRHERMHKVMALKVLRSQLSRDPNVRARFDQEAHALSNLENRHTVAVFDFGETPDGQLYLAMEHLKGRTLASALTQGPLSPSRAVHILSQVLKSLEEAHAKGIVHRDIKPDNIFLVDSEEADFVKLIDFGIAKTEPHPTTPRPGATPLTQDDLLVGTPEYMAPEQARGQHVDARSDVWAVGLVLCECLTGRRPFTGPTPIEVIMAILQNPLPQGWELNAKVDIPDALWGVVSRALSKEASGRYPSAKAMREAMENALTSQGLAMMPTPVATRPVSHDGLDGAEEDLADRDEWSRYNRRQRQKRWFLGVVTAAGLAGAGGYMAPQLLAQGQPVQEEVEPNDDAATANLIKADDSITGTLSVPQKGVADKDLFTLELPLGPHVLDADVDVRDEQRVNLGITAWVDGKILFTGYGRKEPHPRVRHMVVDGARLTLMVREENATRDVPPTPTDVPYRLTLRPLLPVTLTEEREPNNRRDQATLLPEDVTMEADLTPSDDEDTFKLLLPADDVERTLEVVPEPGVDVDVALVSPDGRVVTQKKSRKSEHVTFPLAAKRCGSPCTVSVTANGPVAADGRYSVRWKK